MSGRKSKSIVSTVSMDATAATTTSSGVMSPRKRITQNYLLIWVDANVDQSKEDCNNKLAQLQNVVNDVHVFAELDEAIDFLTEIGDMKAFLLVNGTMGQLIVPLIHDISQLDAICIVCEDQSIHEQWTTKWSKIKGIHKEIKQVCEVLQLVIKQYNQDSIAISFVPMVQEAASQNLNQLEPNFMYTQIFKEILLQMKYDENSLQDFIQFWRRHYMNNTVTLNTINQFEHDYRPESSIEWYTRETFIYTMLNQALRLLEGDTIINMGFFICDLHQQITQLHQKQISNYNKKSFTVYRGQGLSKTNFEKLLKSKGGLMSFNNFLSTSDDRDVSLFFATSASTGIDTIGILFEMTIDPSVSSAPFASIREVSHFQTEEEILFSMHTVFRVCEITELEKNYSSLYQVDLQLTADDDGELRNLTQYIRKEVVGETGWQRLGQLLIKVNQLDKAEELYNVLLEKTSDQGEKATYYNNLGYIEDRQGDYKKATEYYKKSLENREITLPLNHPDLATSCNNIAAMYDNMGEYSKALSVLEKSLEIREIALPANHPLLATSYNNIGTVYKNMGEYSKALSYYEKDLRISEKILPSNHPTLAISYSNIGLLYDNMGDYSKALSFHEKSLKIREKTLSANHPDLATSYNNIGLVYENMGDYSKALSFYKKSLEIREIALSANHPLFANSYSNIAAVYDKIGEYSKALSFYEKGVGICEKALPANHPELATSYNNIAGVYKNIAEYSKALSFLEKSLEIREKTLPANHPDLATSYNNMGDVYDNMGEYSKALLFLEKSLKIREITLPANHPELANSYNNIGSVYYNIGEYSKSLSFYEKTRKIFEKALPANHPELAISYSNIGSVYDKMGEYSKALSFHKKTREIFEKTLSANHPSLATSYNNIGSVYCKMGDDSTALLFFEKSLEIQEISLPANHPELATSYYNIGSVYDNMGEYSKALSYFQRAQNIWQSSLPSNHPHIQSVQRRIEYLKTNM